MQNSAERTIGLQEFRDTLGIPLLFALAQELGLSQQALRDALASNVYASKVQSDFLGGVRSGVNGTPTFFINGRRHEAAFDFRTLLAAIDAELSYVQTAG